LDVDKHYSEREKYYRIVFNRLATRQLFDEMKASREAVDHYFGVITSAVKDFPPYMNEVLKIYPYDDREILKVTPNL